MVTLFNIGVLAGMRPCGVIVLLSELFIAESKTQVYGSLHNYYSNYPVAAKNIGMAYKSAHINILCTYLFIEYICYDDACHLRRFARNPIRAHLTLQTKQLAEVGMVVDKMHMKGHIDPWCKANGDPGGIDYLNPFTGNSAIWRSEQ
jgi:hypothetical protein